MLKIKNVLICAPKNGVLNVFLRSIGISPNAGNFDNTLRNMGHVVTVFDPCTKAVLTLMEVSSCLVKSSSHWHYFQLSCICCMEHGPNHNIKCICTNVRCPIFDQHAKCKCPCTKYVFRFPHTRHHSNADNVWLELLQTEILRTKGGHTFQANMLRLKLVSLVQYTSCVCLL